jgi:hypothetical protein
LNLTPLECYKTYISIKNHFTQKKYDYHKYNGKVKASLQSFYKRKDRFWFEKMSRIKTEEEVKDFFVANFVHCEDPQTLWIGEIIKNGESNYREWMKKNQSLTYIFKEELNLICEDSLLNSFKITGSKHSKLIKLFLSKKVSLETLVILNKIFNYKQKYDKELIDPVWEFISMKIEKYSSFVRIDVSKYKNIIKEFIK